jgi:hypothetical protein
MKVLLRDYQGSQYSWHDAEYDKNLNFRADGNALECANVVSVLDDDATKYVHCSRCATVFLANSQEAKAHVEAKFAIENCYKCKYLRVSTRAIFAQNFTPMPSGNFVCNTNCEAELRCTTEYPYTNITTPDILHKCAMIRCNGAELLPVETFFTRYPGAFDAIITVDRLLECGLQEENSGLFPVKGRNSLYAKINTLGIVDRFILRYNNNSYDLYYSKKYGKCFLAYRFDYIGLDQCDDIPSGTATYVTKKIAALYDEIEVE